MVPLWGVGCKRFRAELNQMELKAGRRQWKTRKGAPVMTFFDRHQTVFDAGILANGVFIFTIQAFERAPSRSYQGRVPVLILFNYENQITSRQYGII